MRKSVGKALVLMLLVGVGLVVPSGSASAAYAYATPTGLKSTAQTSSTLSLDWNDVPRATKYRIQLSKSSSMSAATYFRFDESEGTIAGLSPSTKYYFRVVVIDPVSAAKLSEYTLTPYPSASTTTLSTSRFTIPASLRSTSQTSSTLGLAWDAVEDAPGYRIQLSTSSAMSNPTYHRFTTNKATITGLKPSTKYYFRVRVIEPVAGTNLGDYTAKPYPSASTTLFDFATPGDLTSDAQTTTSLSLTWDAVEDAPGYRIQLSTSSAMSSPVYYRFTTNKATLTGLKPSTKYYFRVRVIEPVAGTNLSEYTAKPYPSASTGTTVTPPPSGFAIPTNLRSTSQTSSTLGLDWDAVEGAPGYRIQLSTSSAMSSPTYYRFTTNNATLTGLKATTKYYFRVRVIEPVAGTNLGEYTAKPYPSASTTSSGFATPTNLTSDAQGATSLSLKWDAVEGAPGYRIQLSTSSAMSSPTYYRFTTNKATLTGLKATTKYYFRVRVIEPVAGTNLGEYTAKPYPSASTTSTPTTPPTETGPHDVTVGSFNISGADNDKLASGERKLWRDRRAAVVDDIISEDVEVLGVQEANQSNIYSANMIDGDNQFLDLRDGLQAAGKDFELTNDKYYNCERHTSSNNCTYVDQGASHGTRILYDADELTLRDEGSFQYANQSAGTAERFLAWAVLEDKGTGEAFFFTNTHLDPYSTTVSGRQWQELITKTKQLNTGNLPVISVGDFNSSKFNQPAGNMLVAMKAAGVSDVLNQEYQVNPARNPRAKKIVNGFYNSFNGYVRDLNAGAKCYCTAQNKTGNGIDYIFATNSLPVKEFKVVLDVNSKFQLVGTIPSDHHMVKAIITLP